MQGLASTIGRGVRAATRVLVILAAAGPWGGARAQAPAVEAVDDIFAISHDAVAIKQSLAQTAPNVQSNDENLPAAGVVLRVTVPPSRGRLDRFDERVGSFVYTPNYNGADAATQRWDGTDRFVYTIYVGGEAASSASVTIGTRYDGYTYFIRWYLGYDATGRDPTVILTREFWCCAVFGGERGYRLLLAPEGRWSIASGRQPLDWRSVPHRKENPSPGRAMVSPAARGSIP